MYGQAVLLEIHDVYKEMYLRNSPAKIEQIRFVVIAIESGQFVISKIYRQEDVQGKDVDQFFLSLLDPDRCLFLLYDCPQGPILVTW